MAVQNGYGSQRETMAVRTMKLKPLAVQFVHFVFVGLDHRSLKWYLIGFANKKRL